MDFELGAWLGAEWIPVALRWGLWGGVQRVGKVRVGKETALKPVKL